MEEERWSLAGHMRIESDSLERMVTGYQGRSWKKWKQAIVGIKNVRNSISS
jgi:hypothetical protein